MDSNVETIGALSAVSLPVLVAFLVSVVRQATGIPSRVVPLLVLVGGVGMAFLADAGGVVEYSNPFALVIVGMSTGMAAVGARELWRNYTPDAPPR